MTPPIPPDVDLTGFPYMPIHRARLFNSTFHLQASDAEWRAGVTLWLKSWDQHPSGSLPNNDADLCRLAELGRDLRRWKKLKKMALLHWNVADDGRLYHGVVTEYVTYAWNTKIAREKRTHAARQARHKSSVTENATEPVTGSNRKEKKRKEITPLTSPPFGSRLSQRRQSPVTNLFEGAHRAAEAIIARMEATAEAGDPRDLSNGEPVAPALLDGRRSC